MYLIALANVCKLDFNGLWIVYKTTKHCIDAIQQWGGKKYSVWLNKQRNLKQSGVLLSTLMTTECSLEGAPYMFVCICIHKNMLWSVFTVVTSTANLSII